MKREGITKAEERLRTCREARSAFASAKSPKELQSAWLQFLIASNSFFEILKAGARSNPRAKQWIYGTVEKQRREDPLLKYVHQARNTEEHGIDVSTSTKPGHTMIGLGLGYSKSFEIRNFSTDGWGKPSGLVKTYDGLPVKLTYELGEVNLLQVVDERYGTVFPVPDTHLGRQFTASPQSVADATISYMETIISQAKTYV